MLLLSTNRVKSHNLMLETNNALAFCIRRI